MITGYQGYFNAAQTAVILNGDQESNAIATGGMCLVGMILPSAFTGTAITFECSDAIDGIFKPLYDNSNSLVSMTVAQGRAYAIDPANFQGISFLKIKSGSAEAAERVVTLALKGL